MQDLVIKNCQECNSDMIEHDTVNDILYCMKCGSLIEESIFE